MLEWEDILIEQYYKSHIDNLLNQLKKKLNISAVLPSLNCFNEVLKCWELCPSTPNAQPRHVGHVLRLRGTSGTAVDNPSFGELLLKLENGETCLARLARTGGNKILGFVTLIKYYLLSTELRNSCS